MLVAFVSVWDFIFLAFGVTLTLKCHHESMRIFTATKDWSEDGRGATTERKARVTMEGCVDGRVSGLGGLDGWMVVWVCGCLGVWLGGWVGAWVRG